MVRNVPNVSLEMEETKIQNQACTLRSPGSSLSPDWPTLLVWDAPQPYLHCSGCDAFCSGHSVYSVSTRGLSPLSIPCVFVVITHILVLFCIHFREVPVVLRPERALKNSQAHPCAVRVSGDANLSGFSWGKRRMDVLFVLLLGLFLPYFPVNLKNSQWQLWGLVS